MAAKRPTPTVLAITGNDAVVDWVLLELRAVGSPSTVAASRSALAQRDGDVVDTDGTSPVAFAIAPGDSHIAVLHRNHLGCMTSNPVALSPTVVWSISPLRQRPLTERMRARPPVALSPRSSCGPATPPSTVP